ncbi:9038_t:CDS:2, partial [Dentiscutata erythropus]
GCATKVPDFQGYQWPINYQDCVNRGQTCQTACQSSTVSVDKKGPCNQACSASYSNLCGTANQPAAYYNTSDVDAIPSYGPPTNNNTNSGNNGPSGSPTGSSNSSASDTPAKSDASSLSIAFSISSAISALVIVAVGMTML